MAPRKRPPRGSSTQLEAQPSTGLVNGKLRVKCIPLEGEEDTVFAVSQCSDSVLTDGVIVGPFEAVRVEVMPPFEH